MGHPYSEVYLDEVVDTQGRLFGEACEFFPGLDTADFVFSFMVSKTRAYIDEGQAYVATMSPRDLWEYFQQTDGYLPKEGKCVGGFAPDWIGRFYALYQWEYDIPSARVVELLPFEEMMCSYPGLHDLELDLAVRKVGRIER